jgi:hypothetical protein
LRRDEVTVDDALRQAGHNVTEYIGRNGQYSWSKTDPSNRAASRSTVVTPLPSLSATPTSAAVTDASTAGAPDIEDSGRGLVISKGSAGVQIHHRSVRSRQLKR